MTAKHWFIKEEEIRDHEQDAFAHLDIARELKLKIEELGAPLTVALSGRHGIGKSSVGSLLREQFDSDNRYVFVRIEAWRHAGEWRRKAFLLDVAEELSKKLQEHDPRKKELKAITDSLSSTQATQTAVFDVPGSLQAVQAVLSQMNHPVFVSAIIAFLLTFFLSLFFYLVFSGVSVSSAWAAFWHSLPSAFSLPVSVGCAAGLYRAWTFVVGSALEPPKVTITNAPVSSGEQFERMFRDIHRVALEDRHHQTTGRALVVFVDELDRLQPEEIVEALNAIRTFRDVGSSIFVVALDEDVVRHALVTASTSVVLNSDAEKAQEYLNKFFKVRQQIPPLVPRDMRDFAKRLLKDAKYRRVTEGIADLPEMEVEAILDALIHRRVKTPRHVIRLINAFNGDYRLGVARERGANPVLHHGAITDHLPFMGVMTALREDFPDFYEAAVRNPNLIQAMDAFVSGETPAKVEERFPDHEKLCAIYFAPFVESTDDVESLDEEYEAEENDAQSEKTDGQKPMANYGEPKDEQCRALILLLGETALFRPPNIRPFVYFREDTAEREIGGELTERMREEFETNAASLIRGRLKDGTLSHAKAAGQVALQCLEETKGSRKQNTVRVVCEVFDLFADADKDKIASRLTAYLARNEATDISAATLLNIAQHSNTAADRERVVSKLIDRLTAEEIEVSSQDLRAILEHDDLVTTVEQQQSIAEFTSGLPKVQNAVELQEWLRILVGYRQSERIAFDFFGLNFLQNVVQDVATTDFDELPSGYAESLESVLNVMDTRLSKTNPSAYFYTVLDLIGNNGWAIIDLSLKLLEQHVADFDEATATTALTKVLTRIGGKWPETSEGEIQRQLSVHTFVWELIQQLGASVLKNEAVKKGLNDFIGIAVATENDQVRKSATKLFRELMLFVDYGDLDSATDKLMTFVQKQMPSISAEDVQALLVSVADYLDDEKLTSHFEKITLALRQASVDANAEFGAKALSTALKSDAESSLYATAITMARTLVALFQVTTYLPPNLILAGRILDEVYAKLGDTLETYVSNLVTYLGATTTASNIFFALDHLRPIAKSGLILERSKNNLVASVLQSWPYIDDADHKRIAADLLIDWQTSVTVAQRPTYLNQQIGFLEDEPILSWKGLRPFWTILDDEQRMQIIDAGATNEGLWAQILEDISKDSLVLSVLQVVSILKTASTKLEENSILALNHALTNSMPASQRDEVSDSIFASLLSAPDHLSHQSLLKVADTTAQTVVPNGIAYHVSLLHGDALQRGLALESLPRFLGDKQISQSLGDELAAALASALSADRGDRFGENLGISKKYKFINAPMYEEAMLRIDETLSKTLGSDDKAMRRQLKPFLPRKKRNKSTLVV